MIRKPISADSHITEPPNCYVDYIEPSFRDRAPVIKELPNVGDAFVIEGMATPVPLGLLAAAGKEPSQITTSGVAFKDLWRSGWDSKYRLADQDRRRRGGGDDLSHRRHAALQPRRLRFQEGLLRGLQPLAGRVLRRGAAPPARPGPGLDALGRGRGRRTEGGQGDGLQGRDDAGRSGRGGLRQQDLRPGVGDGRGARPAAQLPHPDHQVRGRWRRTRAGRGSTASSPSSAAARTSWAR